MIQSLNQRGVYLKDIAAELEVHPRTVKRARQRAGAPKPERRPGSSKLDLYKAKVDELLGEGVCNSMVILREIQALGYEGSRTILRQYIQPKRAWRPGRATVRFETERGKQLQSDWGEVVVEFAGVRRKVHFIVNELRYSRRSILVYRQSGWRCSHRSANGQPEKCGAASLHQRNSEIR